MPSRVTVRPATEEDAAFAYRVLETTMRSYAEATWGIWNEAAARDAMLEDARASRSSIIDIDGAAAGLLRVDTLATNLQLEQIFLLPEHQRGGVGTKLVVRLQEDARRLNLPLRLRVLRVNPAKRLYERLGFRVVDETPERIFMEYTP